MYGRARRLALGFSLCAAAGAHAQERPTGLSESALIVQGGRTVGNRLATARAVRLEGSISIDGRLDEPAWDAAPSITDFVQGEPLEGAPPTQPTEVRVVFDDGAIYVSAKMHEPEPRVIRNQLVRRDDRGSFDYFTVSLDPNRDGLTGYQFTVSAAGAERDVYLFSDSQEDQDWDAIWDSAVGREGDGWTVELRIPLSQIRYEARRGEQTWGVNFTRRRQESSETDYFALESRTVRGRVSQFGTIDGLQVAAASRRLEVTPFLVSQYHTAPSEAGNPLFDGTELDPRGGVDLSVGIGSAFSLDATFNPDFGQVEVDPEVINLTAFETFFPEKRPFFVQDARVFDFTGQQGGMRGRGGKTLFFSRRIGRSPGGSPPEESSFSDVPGQTAILGAAKLTGRTSGGLSVGALAAVTGREHGDAYFTPGDSLGRFVAEPRTEYGVVRLQQDLRGGGTKFGAIATGLKRELPGDGSFEYLPSTAFSFGIDFEHMWGGASGRDLRLWGFYSGSLVNGSQDALVRIQQSSTHYFQRPDADYLAVDSTRTSLFGADWRIQIERQNALHWTWNAWLGEQSPGFEINDFGFNTSGEKLDVGASISYREIRPGDLFRNYNISIYTFHNLRHSLLDDVFSGSSWARAHESGTFWINSRFTFLNDWGMNVRASYSPESQSDTQTRGGPLMTAPGDFNIGGDINTDRRAAVSVSPSLSYRKTARSGGQQLRAGFGVTLRPVSNWEIELRPSYTRERNAAQYVTSSSALAYEPTFGTRYLFGDLQQHSLSMDTRLNVAFTPDLSLQLFAQPLISSGDYRTYRQLAAAETFDFLDFTEGSPVVGDDVVASCAGGDTCVLDEVRYFDFDSDGTLDHETSDRDFNVLSLRGNAVLRWEYRPGSQLFLVWQHSRRDRNNLGDLDLGRDFGGLFSAPAENVFIIKVSHYLSF